MDKLVFYVSAIHGHPGPVAILRHTVTRDSWWDQGIEVQKEDVTYFFDNGAVIRRSVELDKSPTELVCAECWVDYEVIEHPLCQKVSPARKNFDNACRESFWLKYHTA